MKNQYLKILYQKIKTAIMKFRYIHDIIIYQEINQVVVGHTVKIGESRVKL
jgi:hypothetical protein